jgi:acetylornithine deacetylase
LRSIAFDRARGSFFNLSFIRASDEDVVVADVTEILLDLIGIPSVSSGSNRAMIEHARDRLQASDWQIRTFAYADPKGIEKVNLVATPKQQSQTDAVELALVCHTDTVPYPDDWAEAVNPKMVDGRIYGRGACDVKGFLACILAAVSDLDVSRHSLAVVLTADEEIGCIGAKRLLEEKQVQARYAVVGEPTRLHPVVAGKGYALGEVVVRGKAAHSAFPQAGRSAIFDAITVIDAIRRIDRQALARRHERFDPPFTTINIGTIAGGSAKNIVPAECRFLVEWRPIPGQSELWIADQIREGLAEAVKADPCLQATFEVIRADAGFETELDCKLVTELESLSGNPAQTVAFGTEAPYLKRLGAETVVFGPGDMLTAHTSDENVPVGELERCVEVLKELAARLAFSSA